MNYHKSFLFALLFFLAQIGCAMVDEQQGGMAPSYETQSIATRFSNVPIPPGFEMDRTKSFIYESGSGTTKVGKLFFSGWKDAKEIIEFYRTEMPAKGWKSISIVEQNSTIMIYEKEKSLCSITISPSLLRTKLQINVGPK